MAISRFRIEAFFDTQALKYFSRSDNSSDAAWVLFFGPCVSVIVHLWENGEYVLMRSLPVINLKECLPENRLAVLEKLMQRNRDLSIGHYGGTEEITFEASMGIEDGEVTDQQLERMIRVVVGEVEIFGPQIRRIGTGQPPLESTEESIEDLINRLIDSEDDTGSN